MANQQHHDLGNQASKMHGLVWQSVANTAALAALTITADDIAQQRVVRQLDNAKLWVPIDVLPTFQPLIPTVADLNITSTNVGNVSTAPGTTVTDALNNVKDVPNVDVATTGNIALTGTPANIDAGVALVSGATLILVWMQTTPSENGVYLYNSAGAWTRATGWTAVVNFRTAQPFQVTGGTLYGGHIASVKLAPTVVGASSIIFNMSANIAQPTADGQTLIYNQATNQFVGSGIKTAQLADADAHIDVTMGSNFVLQTQLTGNRTITIDNTGALEGWAVTFDIRVALAFTLTINNAIPSPIRTFTTGKKWYGSCAWSSQWFALPFQEQS